MSGFETVGLNKFFSGFYHCKMPFDIYTAASLGDISFFIKYDVSKLMGELSVPNEAGWTPLMYACARGHSVLVNYLLMLGVKRNCKSKSGVTPLMLAISSADLATVESVFDFSSLEEKDYRQWTPLFYAIHYTRERCLKYLLTRGANVNIVDYESETPLLKAIKSGRETMVELLLKTATNLDVVSFKNESAIMLASESSNTAIRNMVKNRLEYLSNTEKKEKCVNLTPVRRNQLKRNLNCSQGHCSPTPLKQQLKLQWSNIKMNKSLRYSPNKTPTLNSTPKGRESDPWKWGLTKKFWSPQLKRYNDVEEFLKRLGLEKYWPIFRDEEVDFETLLTLNEVNLKELGIELFGPRKKIYLAIQQIKHFY